MVTVEHNTHRSWSRLMACCWDWCLYVRQTRSQIWQMKDVKLVELRLHCLAMLLLF